MSSATLQEEQYFLVMRETRLEQQLAMLTTSTTSVNIANYSRDPGSQ